MKFGRGTFNMQRQRIKKQDAKIISQFFKSNTSQFYSTGIMLLYFVLYGRFDSICKGNHRIIGYLELEGTHKHHRVQLLKQVQLLKRDLKASDYF